MKKWGLAVFLLFGFLFNRSAVNADDFFIAFYGAYDETNQAVMLEISVREDVSLEAFTFSVEYDETKYELYEANDELPKGYGYDEAFRLSYQSGTALSNALAGKVIFSGVNASQEIHVYKGVVARAVFLCYPGCKADLSDMRLRVTALHANGNRVDLPNQELLLECMEKDIQSEKGEDGPGNSAIGGFSSAAPQKTTVSDSAKKKEEPLSKQAAQPYGQDALEQTDDKGLLHSIEPVSPYSALTDKGVEGGLKDRVTEEKKEQTKKAAECADDKKKDYQNHIVKYGIMASAGILIVISGYILKRKYYNKKRSRDE